MAAKIVKNNFVVPLEELLEAGCHFGHQTRRWHPKMAQYIWSQRDGVHIIDLAKTQAYLQNACRFVYDLTRSGQSIVFVGTKRQAADVIVEAAQKSSTPYVAGRWLGGTLTNWKQLKRSIDRFKELRQKRDNGELDRYTKKERALIDREISRLDRLIGGLQSLQSTPSALFVIDVKREEAAVREAKKIGVTVVAMVDTNSNPDVADFVIPANDDAVRSIRLITNQITDAVIAGHGQVNPDSDANTTVKKIV